MKYLPHILMVVLIALTMVALVTRPNGNEQASSKLGDRITAACKPWLVSDWQVDLDDARLIRVTCYDPKNSNLRYTVVER